MSTLGNRDHDLDDYTYDQHDQNQDREISLGTGTILGIFLALAVVCALFFGFGYAMGRKSAAPTPAADGMRGTEVGPLAEIGFTKDHGAGSPQPRGHPGIGRRWFTH